jgi:hypothetical protein
MVPQAYKDSAIGTISVMIIIITAFFYNKINFVISSFLPLRSRKNIGN